MWVDFVVILPLSPELHDDRQFALAVRSDDRDVEWDREQHRLARCFSTSPS